jgi:hypothetical protein
MDNNLSGSLQRKLNKNLLKNKEKSDTNSKVSRILSEINSKKSTMTMTKSEVSRYFQKKVLKSRKGASSKSVNRNSTENVKNEEIGPDLDTVATPTLNTIDVNAEVK